MDIGQPIVIKDRSGFHLKTHQVGDYVFFPAFPSNISKRQDNGLNDMESEEFFDDDILVVSYPRSGFHWTLEVTHMLTQGVIEYEKVTTLGRNIELRPKEVVPANFNTIRPRIIQTHLPLFLIPEKLHKLRMIFIYRNPKDIAYSLYNLMSASVDVDYDGRFEDYILLFQEGKVPLGDYFRYMNSWEKFIRENKKLYFSYEQFHEDPIRIVRMLADYLSIEADNGFMQEIINKCTLDKMKKHKVISSIMFKEGRETFLRKGVVGDWKNHFTVAMSEEFDEVLATRMPDTQFKFQYDR